MEKRKKFRGIFKEFVPGPTSGASVRPENDTTY